MIAKKSGYILVTALFIISLASIFVTSLLQKTLSYDRLSRTLLRQQQARMLALSGIEVARAQLSNPYKLDEKDKEAIDANITPFLYVDQMQTFTLTEEKDGIKGRIKIHISSEQGKINLNGIYNFDEQKITNDKNNYGQKVVALLQETIHKKFGIENFENALTQLLKKRGRPFEDLTEIPVQKAADDIFDLFTLTTTSTTLQPLYFSDGLAEGLRLEKQKIDKKQRLEIVKKLNTRKGQINWQQQWKELLAPLYKKEYNEMADVIQKNIASKIEVASFFVISYGTVVDDDSQDMTQKVGAYLEKMNLPGTDTNIYNIKRLYWL